jgi:galactose oxidase
MRRLSFFNPRRWLRTGLSTLALITLAACGQPNSAVPTTNNPAGIPAGIEAEPEVELEATSNLALRKTARQSSTAYAAEASRAIDGNTSGDFYQNTVTHTNWESESWWEVDLGNQAKLTYINVFNRTDCCAERLNNWYVMVSNEPITGTLAQALENTSISNYPMTTQSPRSSRVAMRAGQIGRYVRIWLGGGDSHLHLAEVQVVGSISDPKSRLGAWGEVINLPDIAVTAAVLPTGKVLFWSGAQTFSFDPSTQTANSIQISEAGNGRFCPGTAMLANGEVMVNGGVASEVTNIFNAQSETWRRAGNMNIPRGYNASVTLENGNVFTVGGSWIGEIGGSIGGKNAELWNASTDTWTNLTGASAEPLYGYETPTFSDNHGWLFPIGNRVLYAGPGNNMIWYDADGTGAYSSAGTRADDTYAMNGSAVMYDRNKILTFAGASSYTGGGKTSARSYQIDIGAGANVNPTVKRSGDMNFARAYQSAVLLPNGQVMASGGSAVATAFNDQDATLTPEVWNPSTEQWRTLAKAKVPRTYHSVAILMPDARVIAAGGGSCGGCSVNHQDAEIFSPPYLYTSGGALASRPSITSAPDAISYGASFSVQVSGGASRFNLVRMSSITHAVNNDQRLIPLTFARSGSRYSVIAPENSTVATPGYYMLFALNPSGVPSIAKIIKLGRAN